MTSAIDFQNVTFTYSGSRAPALRDVTLVVPQGQICGVVGRAGSGKSTLCYLSAGFVPNFYQGQISGSARVDGQDVIDRQVADLVRHVGLVSSNPFSQISGARFTVAEEIGFGLENLGLPREEIKQRIEWALDLFALAPMRDRSPYALSGGQQQRLVLASTLVMQPPVLVLDEPTAQLDPLTIEELAETLRGLARNGTTILFAEHRLEWAASLAERMIALDGGQKIADGTPEEVLTDERLLERGIGWPRPAVFARRLRRRGLWQGANLPVRLGDLIAALRPVVAAATPADAASAVAAPATSTTPDAGAPIVAMDSVQFSYPSGVAALKGVSLQIGGGERVALLGRNGAGKSTLVRHLNGLLQPSSGQVLVQATDTRTTTVAKNARHVGIVFQDIRNQLFARTVRDELRFGPRNLGYPAERVEALVAHALKALALEDAADEHPYDLPPARRRLVAIAAVLAMDSNLLLLDEPTAGMDNPGIDLLVRLAHELVAAGKSIVVVSHDLDFCYEALDRVVLMRDGQITLDTYWDALDGAAIDELSEAVGLPEALQATTELGVAPASPLGQALLARE